MATVVVIEEHLVAEGRLPITYQDPYILEVKAEGIEVPEFCVQNYTRLIRWLMDTNEWTRSFKWLDNDGICRRRQATYTTETVTNE